MVAVLVPSIWKPLKLLGGTAGGFGGGPPCLQSFGVSFVDNSFHRHACGARLPACRQPSWYHRICPAGAPPTPLLDAVSFMAFIGPGMVVLRRQSSIGRGTGAGGKPRWRSAGLTALGWVLVVVGLAQAAASVASQFI